MDHSTHLFFAEKKKKAYHLCHLLAVTVVCFIISSMALFTMVNKSFCLYSVSLIQFVNLSKQSSIVNLRVLHPKLYCRRQKNLGIPYIPQKIGKFLGWTWRLNADEYKQKCTCRRIRRRTKANANLEISEWTKTSCTTVQLQIFSVFPLTNLEKSSKIDRKSAMQKLRV